MTQPKKLIEVAMPIKEISAESVRDKSIRHGHISTLHLWWARRPLPVCRAVVFASLVPDPLDENCPQAFRDAVELILGKANNPGDPYRPYDDIPYTAAIDKMDDNLRNRLLMFIGKYSEELIANGKAGKTTASGKQLSEFSLIKWDNKNNRSIIGKARKLIWVAHNCDGIKTAKSLIDDFDSAYIKIKNAEDDLYRTPDRHIVTEETKKKEEKLFTALETVLNQMPIVFDPFAGGGAIPLEAARLGCKSFGNDINPVAHILQKGSLEFPQRFGKPITLTLKSFIEIYGNDELKNIPNEDRIYCEGDLSQISIKNRLSFDIKYYSKMLLNLSENEIGHYYPRNAKNEKPVAYYWAKFCTCSNPSCQAQVPLLRQFYLSNSKTKQIYLRPKIVGINISFEIATGFCEIEGWSNRGNLKCPCCGSITEVKKIKEQSINGNLKEKIIVVIYDSKQGKEYRIPDEIENDIIATLPNDIERPTESMQRNSAGGDTFSWGINKWGQMFSDRQLLAMHSFIKSINKIKEKLSHFEPEYKKAIITYLGMFIDRLATRLTAFGLYNTTAETIEHPFGRQAIPFVFDFPEVYPFSDSGGGGLSQLDWIIRYVEIESQNEFVTYCNNSESGDKEQFNSKSITAVITDPPYYDAIAYADLSDFFYVWLKRTIGDCYPLNFATPQTPKTEECTALKHHHDGDAEKAKRHFENKLLQIFDAIEHQTTDIVSIMFAHQSTVAWTTLCNSILNARMNITGSWAIDTERSGAGTKASKAFLSSSVTVSCIPTKKIGVGEFKEVKKAIEKTVIKEVEELYQLGFRGADLLTACFGQAVSEFGRFQKVEKADGSEVTVAELLEMARESAFNALLKGFDGDDFTKFYIGWLQLYGFVESDFDDAAKFSRVGLSIDVGDLFKEHILVKNGSKQTLGTFEDRIKENRNLGERASNFLIDEVHRAMVLYKGTNRNMLLQYIGKVAAQPDSSFWRVVTSLCEILPAGSDDHKQAIGLLTNKESLIRESKTVQAAATAQANLFE